MATQAQLVDRAVQAAALTEEVLGVDRQRLDKVLLARQGLPDD
jgi:hypothetical protein